MRYYTLYCLLGVVFGFVLIKSEVASWYRIQEMFHFHSIHMFGIMLTAIITAFIGVQLVKKLAGRPSLEGEVISVPQKKPGTINYPLGGFIFGFGWGIIGLCPGPIFALVGTGSVAAFILLASALHGTWLYGVFHDKLPK